MTVTAQTTETKLAGNGVQTAFAYSFQIPYQADGVTPAVIVTAVDAVGGITTKTYGVDYNITGVGGTGGGVVTMTTAPASGTYITIQRNMFYVQPTAVANTSFYPHYVETGLDTLEMQIQQLATEAGRSITLPPGELAAQLPSASARAGLGLGFTSSGDITTVPLVSLAASSSNSYVRYPFTATAGQTTFSCVYNVGIVEVFVNGVLLKNTTDYSATNGTSIVLAVGCAVGDLVDVVAFTSFAVANAANLTLSNASYTTSLSGGVSRSVISKLTDFVSVKDFGVKGDGVTDDAAAINTAIASKITTGGQLYFPSSYYYLANPVIYTASNSGEIDVSNATLSLRGEGAQNTIFKGASYLTTVLTIKGNDAGSVASHGYETHGDFGVYNAAMLIQSKAYTKFQNINLALANLTVTSCLVCEFDHLSVRSVVGNGITITQGTGFSEHNNNLWSRLNLNNCSLWGMTTGSSQYVTNINIQSVDVEACGTQGNASTGGIYLAFNDDQGAQGGAINGGYFEGNAGNADLQLYNAGTTYIPFTVENCNFNRISNTGYTTYNIVLTGKIRLLVKGCSFRDYGTYVPSSGRPYIYSTDGLAEIIYDNSTYFQTAVSTPGYTVMRPLQAAKEAVAWVRFNVSGGVCSVVSSSGLAASTPVVYNSTGQYTINYANTLSGASNSYVITLVGSAGVAYVWAETTSSVTIRSSNTSGTLTDFSSYCVAVFGL